MDLRIWNSALKTGQAITDPIAQAFADRQKYSIEQAMEDKRLANEMKIAQMRMDAEQPYWQAHANLLKTQADNAQMQNNLVKQYYDQATTPTAPAVPYSKDEQIQAINQDRMSRGEPPIKSLDELTPESREAMNISPALNPLQQSTTDLNTAKAMAALGMPGAAALAGPGGAGADQFGNSPFIQVMSGGKLVSKPNPNYSKPLDVNKEQAKNEQDLMNANNKIAALQNFVQADKGAGMWTRFLASHAPWADTAAGDLNKAAAGVGIDKLVMSGLPAAAMRGQNVDMRVMASAPTAGGDPQANLKLANRLIALAQHARDYTQAKTDWLNAGNNNYRGLDQQWQEYNKNFPLWDQNGQVNQRPAFQDWMTQRQGGGGGPALSNLGYPAAASPVPAQPRAMPMPSGAVPAPSAAMSPAQPIIPSPPSPQHIQFLMQHPEAADVFDKQFGQGAAAHYLQQSVGGQQ